METIGSRILFLINNLAITKTAFAETIKVSQAFISQLCANKREPSERTISDICEKYHVNREWLLVGKGDPFMPMTRAQEIAAYANALMEDSPESERSIIIAYIMSLDAEDWEAIAGIIKKHGLPGQNRNTDQKEPTP